MSRATNAALLAATLALAACGTGVAPPPARPLDASPARLAAIPAFGRGAHAVIRGDAVQWQAGERALRVRAVYPEGAGPVPLVVFSHGFASDVDQYDAVLDHWASHGYAVVAPYHLDGGGTPRAIFNSVRMGNLGLIAARVDDMKRVLDHLDALDAIAPGLAARIDRRRIAVAGHSFGAFTAQQLGGAVAEDDDGRRVDGRDRRVGAVVALSPPGEMFGVINARSWRDFDAPLLATTGTWDTDGRFVTDWHQHALSFDTARPGRNWLLVVAGADHYLGNLICRTRRAAPPQRDALRMVNAVTTAFLDAQLKEDPAARAFLEGGALQRVTDGFATLSRR